jgi:putative drug exporter of the RND superfamily
MAVGITVGLCAMLTLLPALLVIFGRWVFWPRRPTLGSAEPTERGLWARIGQRMARRPRLVWIVAAVVLGVLALGLTGLEANGLQNKDAFRTTPESVTGDEVLGRHFPAGAGDPVQVIGRAEAAGQLQAALSGSAGVTAVTRPVVKDGYAYLEATLTTPSDSQASYRTIDRLRSTMHAIQGADAKVGGGGSAVNLDIQRATRHDRNLVVPLVLVVVMVILGLVLRAVISPLLLAATVVLSFAAALGVSAQAFDHLFKFNGVDPSLPLWTFVFLVALGTDYNIFLMTRVHEEARRHGTRRGALIGLAATGGVITSAGVVLAGTFAALGTLPLVFITEIGFTVAFGVLLDTFIVRSVLVTALNLDVGRWIWWPSNLFRKHDIDIGELQEKTTALTR